MCGIAGFIDFTNSTDKPILQKMTDTMSHRGPDGAGYEVFNADHKVSIGFGHRRLSIIDPQERSRQPMQRGKLWITFNGEIYNFKEIKASLINDHHQSLYEAGFSNGLTTEGDTEVVLAAYAVWGTACVEQFRGMFAFAIYDERLQRVLLFRDRSGIKPLFHYKKGGLHLFASELKAFHQHPDFDKSLNHDAVNAYFRYGYVPSQLCIFKHVQKVQAGNLVSIELSTGKTKKEIYWNPTKILLEGKPTFLSEKERLNEIEKLLQENFEYRMVSDVPVGVFLSGGYDSSLVSAMLQKDRNQKINTFTIGFKNAKYNEAQHAEKVAKHLGTNHHQFFCTEKEAQEIIPQLPYFYDEPFADSSAIPTFLVSQLTSSHVKVALSADGGDELFAGYRSHSRFLDITSKVSKLPKLLRLPLAATGAAIAKAHPTLGKAIWWHKMAAVTRQPNIINTFDVYPQYFCGTPLNDLLVNNKHTHNPRTIALSPLKQADDAINAMLSADFQSSLIDDMIVKVDRATMANGLEGRDPMLDHTLYEYLVNVSSSEKLGLGNLPARKAMNSASSITLKYLLKEITHRHIPREIMERPKQGFAIPIQEWLTSELKGFVDHLIDKQHLERYGILHVNHTLELKNKLLNLKERSEYLWTILSFQMWCKRWL